jgi:hypothetical protein
LLHQQLQLLKTSQRNTLRAQRYTEKVLKQLTGDVASATRIFLKVRKARELDNDLPREDAYQVDNKSWRKLLEMEKKAYKIVEQVATYAENVAKGGTGFPLDESEDVDEGDIEGFMRSLK